MKNYIKTLKNDKKEMISLAAIALLSFHLTLKLTGGFSTTLKFDIVAEISGYLIMTSTIICLFISQFKQNLNHLGLATSIISFLNFAHIRALESPYQLKLVLFYLAIFLSLICITKILKK